MPGKQRARLFAVLAVLIGTCMAVGILALGEIAVRLGTGVVFLGNSPNLFTAERFGTSRGNTPNVEGLAFHEPAFIDAQGFRIPGPGYHYPDPAAARILVLGDSVAFGPGVPEDKTFVGQLRKWKPRWAVFNSSVLGYGLDDYLNVVKTLLPEERFDLVVLIVCLNDVSGVSGILLNAPAAARSPPSVGPPAGHPPAPAQSANASPPANVPAVGQQESLVEKIRGIPLASAANDWLREHSKLYLFLRGIVTDPSARYFLADYANYDDKVEPKLRVLLAIADEVRRAGIPLLIVVSPYEYQLRAPQDQTAGPPGSDILLPQKKIEAFMAEHGVKVLDAAEFFRAQGGDRSEALFLPFDPMHFSAEGHTVMFRYLQGLLETANLPGLAARPEGAGGGATGLTGSASSPGAHAAGAPSRR